MAGSTKKIVFNITFVLFLGMFSAVFMAPEIKAAEFAGNKDKFIYTADDRSDPFVPLLSSKGLIKEMGPSTREEMMNFMKNIKVSGIMWDETLPVVMMNKKMRKVGDIVENLTIKQININSVILEYKDQTHEIVLIKKKKMNDQGGIE